MGFLAVAVVGCLSAATHVWAGRGNSGVRQLLQSTSLDGILRSDAEQAGFISDQLPDTLPPELKASFRRALDVNVDYNKMGEALARQAAPKLSQSDLEADARWWASDSGREIAKAESSIYAALMEGSSFEAYNPTGTPPNPDNAALVSEVIATGGFPEFVGGLMEDTAPSRSCLLMSFAVNPERDCVQPLSSSANKKRFGQIIAPIAAQRYLKVSGEDLKAYLAYLRSHGALERITALRAVTGSVEKQSWQNAFLQANTAVDTYARSRFGHGKGAALDEISSQIDAGADLSQPRLILALMNRGGPPNPAVLVQLARVTLKQAQNTTVNDAAPSVPGIDKQSLREARHYVDQAVALDATRGESVMISGHVAYLEWQFQRSVDLLEKAKSLGAKSPWLHVNLGDAYFALALGAPPVNHSYLQRAAEEFEIAMQSPLPQDAEERVIHQLAPVYAELGKISEADPLYQRYVALQVGKNRAYALHRYAHFLLFYAKDDDAALKAARDAVQLFNFRVGQQFLVQMLTIKAGHLVSKGHASDAAPLMKEARGLRSDLESMYPDLARLSGLFPGVIGIHSDSGNKGFSGRLAGQTLVYACLYATSEQIKMLLSWGADPNFFDPDDGTPLHMAILADNLEAVKMLLAHGANPMTPFHDGRLPSQLESASSQKREAILALVRKAAGSSGVGTDMPGTPLMRGYEYELKRDRSSRFNGRDWGDSLKAGEHLVYIDKCRFEDPALACLLVRKPAASQSPPLSLAIEKEQLGNWSEWFREIGPAVR